MTTVELSGGRLIEREGDLALVRAAGRRAQRGEGSLVVVQGTAGIGKTGFLRACARRAALSGLSVLDARCQLLERDFTYAVARQLFGRAVPQAVSPECDPGESASLDALQRLAASLAAERPLMLAIDDAQWADAASLRFVAYLANRLASLPVVVVLAAGSDVPAPQLLEGLTAGATVVVSLTALSAAGSARVVRRRVEAGDAFAQACHDCSGGNPFLLDELVTAVRAASIVGDGEGADRVRALGPAGVSRALALRLGRLPAGASDVARAVAILGDDVELDEASRLAGLPVARTAGLVDALALAGVLAPDAPLRFMQPVLKRAIESTLGPGERAAMHARAAELLQERGASAERVAAQLGSSAPVGQPWAVQVLRRTARAAMARDAPAAAMRHLDRALRENLTAALRGAILADLGDARWSGGAEVGVTIEALREACELAVDPAIVARATIVLARALVVRGDVMAAAEAILRVLDGPSGPGPGDAARLEAELASITTLNMSFFADVRRRVPAPADVAGETAEELSLLAAGAALEWHDSTATETAAVARRALAGGRLLATTSASSLAFVQATAALLGADCVDEARAVCDAALAQSRVRGDVVGEAVGRALAAMAALRAGDVPDCESNVRAALSLPDVSRVARSAMHVLLARALVERGELDAAERALEEGGVGPQLPVLTPVNGGFHARGLLRIAQGRDDEALADLMEFGARSTACMVRNAANPWRVDAALTCRRLGRSADARSLLDDHDAAAARWGAPVATASGLAGRAAGLRGPAQLALLESARELLATSSCRLDYAKVLFDLGVALRRAGRRRDAQRRLSEAAALATRCGATALATRANDDLRILTAPARRLQFSGVDSLTASERRIALMAAEGMSNSQIAQAVFVTCKTVENHLGNVYMKLAINSRRQLETELGQVGQRAA